MLLLLCIMYDNICMIYFKHAPVFLFPYYPTSYDVIPVIPLKKNNYFLSTSHLVIHFKKVLYYVTTVYVDNVRKKKKHTANSMVLHVFLKMTIKDG